MEVSLTDGQIATVLSALGVMVAALTLTIRWSFRRLIRSMDRSTEATLASATAFAVQSTKLDQVYGKVDDVHEFLQRTPPSGHRRAKSEPHKG